MANKREGDFILNNYDKDTGLPFNSRIVSQFPDGTTITDGDVDNKVILKNASRNGGGYSIRSFDVGQSKTLVVDNVEAIRNLSKSNVNMFRLGVYTNIRTEGYYEPNDGGGFDYLYNPLNTTLDDGFLYIKPSLLTAGRFTPNIKDHIPDKISGILSDGNEVSFTGTDNKQFFDKLILASSLYEVPVKIKGKYATTPFIIKSNNVKLDIEQGSHILGYTNSGVNDRLITVGDPAFRTENLVINGFGSYVKCPVFGAGEQRHNIRITNASNIQINGLKVIGGGGDGVYIGYPELNKHPENIFLNNIHCINNRRNGISVVSGKNIIITDPVCEDINQTLPMAGIDIEPNDEATAVLENVRIINPVTKNCHKGILFILGSYVKNAPKKTDIIISGHISIGDTWGFAPNGSGSNSIWNNSLTGNIRYQGSIYNAKENGLNIGSWSYEKAPTTDIDIYIENSGDNAPSTLRQSPILLYAGPDSAFDIGNVNIKARIKDTRATPKHFTDIYLYNNIRAIRNVNINIDSDNRRTSPYNVFDHNGTFIGKINYLNKPEYPITTEISTINSTKLNGGLALINTSNSMYLPTLSKVIGSTFEFKQNIVGKSAVFCATGDSIIIDGAKVNFLVLTELGESIELLATVNGWQLLKNTLSRSSNTNDKPAVTKGILYWYDKGLNKPVFWSGSAWINLLP